MASELAATDPAEARGLLDEAFARLRKVASEREWQAPIRAVSSAMAALLPLVERLEPDRLEERLWLAAACRAPLRRAAGHRTRSRRAVILAMLVSRYDRAMAAAIIAPALERLPELLADSSGISSVSTTARRPSRPSPPMTPGRSSR